jgi:hypothetical protein
MSSSILPSRDFCGLADRTSAWNSPGAYCSFAKNILRLFVASQPQEDLRAMRHPFRCRLLAFRLLNEKPVLAPASYTIFVS